MTAKKNISIEFLRQALDYNPETGELFWKYRPPEMFSAESNHSQQRQANAFNGAWGGRRAFTYVDKEGYCRGAIMGMSIRAHTAIWALVHGEWPINGIDHENTIRHKNHFKNLREATHTENARNSRISKNNTSGFKGVYWNNDRQRWVAQITVNYKAKYLGLFTTPEGAYAAYMARAKELFGEFARF